MLSYPVWSSSVEYIHIQCNTVFFSFIWKRGMQFGADPSSQVQWLSCMVLSSSIQGSAVCWILSWRYDSPIQSSEVLSGSVQSSPLHWRVVQSIQWNLRPSSPVPSSPILFVPVQFQFIPFQLSTFQSSVAQVHISQWQSSLVQSSAVHSSAILTAQPSPVPSSPEQLIATESRTTQSCSVELGTTTCILARPVKWSAIPKSPHLSPYKCISVQCCLQLSHQHKEERLLTLS